MFISKTIYAGLIFVAMLFIGCSGGSSSGVATVTPDVDVTEYKKNKRDKKHLDNFSKILYYYTINN